MENTLLNEEATLLPRKTRYADISNVVSQELELDFPGKYKTAVKKMVDDYKPSDVKLACPVKTTIIPNCTNLAFKDHPKRS